MFLFMVWPSLMTLPLLLAAFSLHHIPVQRFPHLGTGCLKTDSLHRVFWNCGQLFCHPQRDISDLVQERMGWNYFCIIGTIATSVMLPKQYPWSIHNSQNAYYTDYRSFECKISDHACDWEWDSHDKASMGVMSWRWFCISQDCLLLCRFGVWNDM